MINLSHFFKSICCRYITFYTNTNKFFIFPDENNSRAVLKMIAVTIEINKTILFLVQYNDASKF